MSIRKLAATAALAFSSLGLFVPSVHAQLFRAYLSSTGSDSAPCTLAAPCRLLPAALAKVASGGEIWMLDSANYNTSTVYVSKSVSILAVPGAVGSLVAPDLGGALSVVFDVAASAVTLSLRNVVLVPLPGAGPTAFGVDMRVDSTVIIEDSVIAGFANGVYAQGHGKVRIVNSTFSNCTDYAVAAKNGMTVEVHKTRFLNGGGVGVTYVAAGTITRVNVSDSVFSRCATAVGAYTDTSGSGALVSVTRSTIDGCTSALFAGTAGLGSAVITVSDSMLANNNSVWYQAGVGSELRSLGNNQITDNFVSSGTLTPVPLQ
jgi:hypothetical protein